MKNDCVFCGIAEGEIPSFKVYEDEQVLAYLDINPFAKGHTLVIPKAHSKGLLDTDDAALADLVVKYDSMPKWSDICRERAAEAARLEAQNDSK